MTSPVSPLDTLTLTWERFLNAYALTASNASPDTKPLLREIVVAIHALDARVAAARADGAEVLPGPLDIVTQIIEAIRVQLDALRDEQVVIYEELAQIVTEQGKINREVAERLAKLEGDSR